MAGLIDLFRRELRVPLADGPDFSALGWNSVAFRLS
jgi:hypothetical protein